MSEAKQAALRAKAAAPKVALLSTDERNQILLAMAAALRDQAAVICAENAKDMELARAKGTRESILDRLYLDEGRVFAMAEGLESLAMLPDPVGRVLESRELYNGLKLTKVSVPLGVVAMVYEARPNVTADAAGICLKSGNACVLRGGSLANHSNIVITNTLRDAATAAGAPVDAIVGIESTDRAETDELLKLHGLVDVLIPRGGAGLIAHCVENGKVPVIETGTGNCHVYVEKTADQDMALNILHNAKTQRIGVCNACESVLVDEAIADEFLPRLVRALADWGVMIHGDEATLAAARAEGLEEGSQFVAGTEEDWGREYLAMDISVKVVSGYIEAIDHINRYGTGHSESIVTADEQAARAFQRSIDAAAVYVNASTRFSDGGEFGLGAEIGISTQKLHVRGPFALEALTSYKYLIEGEGQVRG